MKYYTDIEDLPLYNWLKIQGGKKEYCRISLSEGTAEEDEKYEGIIQDSYYDSFGFGSDMEKFMDLQKEFALLQMEWVISQDNFLKNRMRIIEGRISDFLKRPAGKSSIEETKIALSKWMGSRLDDKMVTVKEFYTMIKMFSKEQEARIAAVSKNK